MTADILQRLNQDQVLTATALADLLNIAPRAAYRRFDETELTYSEVRTLIKRSGDCRVAFAFLDDLLAGTGIIAMRSPASAALDADFDGDVDTDDVRATCVTQVKLIGERLPAIEAAIADRKIDATEAAPLKLQCRAAIESLMILMRQIDEVEQRTEARRCRASRDATPMMTGATR